MSNAPIKMYDVIKKNLEDHFDEDKMPQMIELAKKDIPELIMKWAWWDNSEGLCTIKAWLDKNAAKFTIYDINELTKIYTTGFKKMIDYGSGRVINFVLQMRPDIYSQSEYGFIDDAIKGNDLKPHLENSIDIHVICEYALIISCSKGFYSNVKLLLDAGAKIHTEARFGEPELEEEETSLMFALYNEHADVVKLLIDRGADVHVQSDKPLAWCIAQQKFKMIKLLIENGANPNARNIALPEKGVNEKKHGPSIYDETLLCEIKYHGNYKKDIEILTYLIAKGADIKARDNMLIKKCLEFSPIELLRFLLENGADAPSCNKQLSQMYADKCRMDVVELFIEFGAEIDKNLPRKNTTEQSKINSKNKSNSKKSNSKKI